MGTGTLKSGESGRRILRRFRSGQASSASHHNESVDLLNSGRLGIAPPRQVVMPAGGAPAEAAALAVKTVFFWYMDWSSLVCLQDPDELTITEPDSILRVAMPFQLRSVPWDQVGRPWRGDAPQYHYTYHSMMRRTAETNPGEGVITELQQITPSYMKGDPLLAAKVPEAALWINNNYYDIEWLDLNIDGRAWAALTTQ